MLGQERLLISEFSLIQQKSFLLFMCYFFDMGQFASTPSEPATERAIHTFACKDATSSEHMNKKGAEKMERDAEGCLTSQVDPASPSKD